MDLNLLKSNYESVLKDLNSTDFINGEDRYSGVFLPYPFEEFSSANRRVMIVGRETARWNTLNNKNTISRIVKQNDTKNLRSIIDEAFERYSWHLLDKKGGELKASHRSHFKRFYSKLAQELSLSPRQLIYANLYAWDYNGVSPQRRGKEEFSVIQKLSAELLVETIKFCKPDSIVFAVGCNRKNDETIKLVMNKYFGGYETKELESKKYWRFTSNGMDCYRIAHPRANSKEQQDFRSLVINKVTG
ncbi:hypothetical protein BCS84_18130 [Vibrio cyclitrophicus]|uniref:hypothetical protein n=1 Tax=Vibrio cyclitrophicus TaxID=47951 RepID=UPI0002F3A48D|nr:hypothetical protein [Vibrio cyclitrophicus]OEE17827.1 hypothetical protein OC1_07420 [Vibrio cyclitrophicus ZF207]PMP53291.1 hypothetical protein BCS84_01310 [Vibrio cyclitrophicus]